MPLPSLSDCPFHRQRECKWWTQRETADQAFLIAPSDARLEPVRRFVVEAVERRVAECKQAIDEPPSGEDIWCRNICQQILVSQFVVVLLDESSWRRGEQRLPTGWLTTERNANVYFEYGLALGAKKRAICLMESTVTPPFDTGWLSILQYPPAFWDDATQKRDFEREFRRSLRAIHPVLTEEQAKQAVHFLWLFYTAAQGIKPDSIVLRCRQLMQQRGLAAWPEVSAALRAHHRTEPRIDKGIRRILNRLRPTGYNADQLPMFVRLCVQDRGYGHVVGILDKEDRLKPADIPELYASGNPTSDVVPCDDQWYFAEPSPPEFG